MKMKFKTGVMISVMAAAIAAVSCYKAQKSAGSVNTIQAKATASNTGDPINTIGWPDSYFNKGVGKPIPGDSLRAWVNNYNKAALKTPNTYILKADDLMQILNSDSCVGIAFYHAWNGTSWLQLPYGVTADGNIIKTEKIATTSGSVTWAQAAQWIRNYQQSNPNAPKAHFFGSNIFDWLVKNKGSQSIRFQLGANTNGEQVLMSNANASNMDSSADASKVCPPVCLTINPAYN